MDSAEIENLVGVVFIYLALFGFDYYIITTFRPKGSLYLLYYTPQKKPIFLQFSI